MLSYCQMAKMQKEFLKSNDVKEPQKRRTLLINQDAQNNVVKKSKQFEFLVYTQRTISGLRNV